jgi:hypothetical protein
MVLLNVGFALKESSGNAERRARGAGFDRRVKY